MGYTKYTRESMQSPLLLLFRAFPVSPAFWVQGISRYRPHLESGHESWNSGPGGPTYRTRGINRSWNRRLEEGVVTEPLPSLLKALCPAHPPSTSLDFPSQAQTERRPVGEPRLLQGRVQREWDRAERTNLPSSFTASLSNSAAWKETCFR